MWFVRHKSKMLEAKSQIALWFVIWSHFILSTIQPKGIITFHFITCSEKQNLYTMDRSKELLSNITVNACFIMLFDEQMKHGQIVFGSTTSHRIKQAASTFKSKVLVDQLYYLCQQSFANACNATETECSSTFPLHRRPFEDIHYSTSFTSFDIRLLDNYCTFLLCTRLSRKSVNICSYSGILP